MEATEPKRPAEKAEEICRQFELSAEGKQLLRPGQAPPAFFGLLFANELYRDAIHFMAHLLPKREAVWWGCLCAWHGARPEPPPEVGDALQATVDWVREPSEANRRAAEVAGEKVGPVAPAGAVALAAFWSGGSMSRPDLPVVPPPPELTQTAVAGAVLSAAAQGDPNLMRQRYRQFLHWAIDVANQKNRWQ